MTTHAASVQRGVDGVPDLRFCGTEAACPLHECGHLLLQVLDEQRCRALGRVGIVGRRDLQHDVGFHQPTSWRAPVRAGSPRPRAVDDLTGRGRPADRANAGGAAAVTMTSAITAVNAGSRQTGRVIAASTAAATKISAR